MPSPRRLLAVIAGALLFAATALLLMSAPGLLCDRNSIVPLRDTSEAPR